jgi:hypothetical protein
MEACDEVLLWSLEEWEVGNRIKASKLMRIANAMERKYNAYLSR